jgi:hypothetical protein
VDSPSPHFAALCSEMQKRLPVEVLLESPFLKYDGQFDLGRFSRYWRVAHRHLSVYSR